MSSIREQIDAAFRQARLGRDEPTKNVIGMLKTEVLKEVKSAAGREENDGLWTEVLQRYAKKVVKAKAQFEQLGDAGKESLEEANFELAFCERFLPKKLDEAATEELVKRIASDNGITEAKMMGKLMGLLMKDHRNELDGELTRTVAKRVLEG